MFGIWLGQGSCTKLKRQAMTLIDIDAGTRLLGRVVMESPVRVYPNCVLNHCEVGAFSYLAPGCILHQVQIGRYCSVGDGVMILSSHPTDRLTTSPFSYQTLSGSPHDAAPEQLNVKLAPGAWWRAMWQPLRLWLGGHAGRPGGSCCGWPAWSAPVGSVYVVA